MQTSSLPLHRIQQLGIAVLCVLALLASILYIERGTFMDVAFQTFELIRTQSLAPQVYRFGSGMTQIFPLLAIWCKAPLAVVVFMYSIGVIIYQSILFYYIAFVRKKEAIALMYIIYLCLATTHTFFWIQSEFSQSIPFSFACLAFLHGRSLSTFTIPSALLGIALLITGVFFHPLQAPLFIVFFFLLYFSESNKDTMVVATLIVLLVWGIKHVFFANWYDNMAAERLTMATPFSFTQGMHNMLFNNSVYYLALVFLFVGAILFSLIKKQWLYAVFLPLFSIGYFLFIHWTHPDAELFYLENLMLAIPAVVAFVWVSIVFTKNNFSGWHFNITWFIVLIFVLRILHVSSYYKTRIHTYTQLIEQYKHQKMMLPAAALPKPYLLFAWPSAYEVWMHSTLQRGITASLVFIEDTSKFNPHYSPTQQFRGIRNYPYDSLLPPYFYWLDTTSEYKIK